MEPINRGRQVPGQGSAPNPQSGHRLVGDAPPLVRRVSCPFNIPDCRGCKISLAVDSRAECSITIIAKSLLKGGMEKLNA